MFEACDSSENMAAIFSKYRESVIALQRGFEGNTGTHRAAVRLFIFGDYAFLCTLFGHQGASATYFCLWYLVTQSSVRCGIPHSPQLNVKGIWSDSNQKYDERTLQSMREDLASCVADTRNGGDVSKNGKYHNSIVNDAILPVIDSMYQVSPLPLHIMLGLGLKFYNQLVLAVRNVDHVTLGDQKRELYDEWQNKSNEALVAEEDFDISKAAYSSSVAIQKGFEATIASSTEGKKGGRKRKATEDSCDFPLCAVAYSHTNDDSNLDWVQCSSVGCGRWLHCSCADVDPTNLDNVQYTCFVCLKKTQMK